MKTEEQIMTSGLPDAVIFVFVAIIFLTVLWSFVRCLEDEETRPGTPQLATSTVTPSLAESTKRKRKKLCSSRYLTLLMVSRPRDHIVFVEYLRTCLRSQQILRHLLVLDQSIIMYSIVLIFFNVKKKTLQVQRYFDNTGEF